MANQTFSFEVVSCLLAAMLEAGVVLGSKHFIMMNRFDDSKTASGYEHTFRAAKARAKEINASGGSTGGASTPVTKKTKTSAATTPKTGGTSGKKRARKSKSEMMNHEVDGDDDESPSKRVKSESADEVKGEGAGEAKEEEQFSLF